MKVLITGASGFVGIHLTRELLAHGFEPLLTAPAPYQFSENGRVISASVCDITSMQDVKSLVKFTNPDAIIHLAGIAHVVNAKNERERLSEVNIVGTHNLCAAASTLSKPVCFLFISSSLVYGQPIDTNAVFNEKSLPVPASAYGASKLAGEFVVRSFATAQFSPYIVRPFNHIGPGQDSSFVCPALALKIAAAASQDTIKVGNLSPFRDFTDVREIVRAYRLIVQKQPKEDLFVLGSGTSHRIKDILAMLIAASGKEIKTEIDQALLRDLDPPKIEADARLAQNILGWKPESNIPETIKQIYAEALIRSKN
jgi:GDP-4-dehydro-6-deoxy-D-mannose reductase